MLFNAMTIWLDSRSSQAKLKLIKIIQYCLNCRRLDRFLFLGISFLARDVLKQNHEPLVECPFYRELCTKCYELCTKFFKYSSFFLIFGF